MGDSDLFEGFVEFDRRSAPINTTPYVTVQKKGLLSLNRAAYDAIEGADAVTLLYHPDKRVIALRPTDPSNPRAYPVRRQGSTSGPGTFIVAGTAFAQYHQIPTDVARRYVGKPLGNLLTIDLNDDAPVVTGPRASTAPPQREARQAELEERPDQE